MEVLIGMSSYIMQDIYTIETILSTNFQEIQKNNMKHTMHITLQYCM